MKNGDIKNLEKARRVSPTGFTSALAYHNQEFELEAPNIEDVWINLRLQEMKATELHTLNQDVWNQMLEAGREEYKSKFSRANIAVGKIIGRTTVEVSSNNDTTYNQADQDAKKRSKLPKLELKRD